IILDVVVRRERPPHATRRQGVHVFCCTGDPPAVESRFGRSPAEAGRMALSLEQFIHRLAGSGLLSAEEVRAFQNALPGGKKPADAQALARELVRHKKLT